MMHALIDRRNFLVLYRIRTSSSFKQLNISNLCEVLHKCFIILTDNQNIYKFIIFIFDPSEEILFFLS